MMTSSIEQHWDDRHRKRIIVMRKHDCLDVYVLLCVFETVVLHTPYDIDNDKE